MEVGPVNRSVLYLQNEHRTSNRELMMGNENVKCLDHSNSLKKTFLRDPRVEKELDRAGFLQIAILEYIQLDHNLITSLCDRWRPETSSFHLRVGELTITLADVGVILGIPIEGIAITSSENHDYYALCGDLLGIVPPEDEQWGAHGLKIGWFRSTYLTSPLPTDATVVQVQQRARAVILHILTCRLYVDRSKIRVDLQWLPFLADLDTCRNYSWGSAILCNVYNELSNVALQRNSNIAGCLTLLQIWSWTYLPIGRPKVRSLEINTSKPYGHRWVGSKSLQGTPTRNVRFYRNEFDILDHETVIWQPYTSEVLDELPEICTLGLHSWRSRVPLVCFTTIHHHLPDRVMRQFGLSQHIPDSAPIYGSSRGIPIADLNLRIYESCVMWNNRHSYIQNERVPSISFDDYYSWYWSITRRFVISSAEIEYPYTPRAPLERNVADGVYHAMSLAEEVIEEPTNDPKGKCLNIKAILEAILGKNRMSRPKKPPM